MAYQLGLDTGGTYTDAVLLDADQRIVASAKSLTTHHNLIEGLRGAVSQVLTESFQPVSLVSLSTTLATNALVEGRGRPVCLLLIGYRPEQLKRAKLQQALGGDPHVFLNGGHDASGTAVCELDKAALTEYIKSVDAGVEAYAISSLFSVRNPEHEIQARDLVASLTGKPVSCGHSLSSGLDAPRRALTALLNARLIPLISSLLDASLTLLAEKSVNAPLMVVKGDGSLVSAEVAQASPVETILSGPAASVVGAQFLCDKPAVVVSDMGGTTTDIAIIRNGEPRLSPNGATVGGWQTMVEAVDVRTFGLGGDSRIVYDREERDFTVGPERVMPLSLLCKNHPELKATLEQQLELPFSTTHSAEFVFAHAADPVDLTLQQQELWEKIKASPLDVQTLFNDQTLDRALNRLTQRGIVLRAGFTPSDASHLLGLQTGWDSEGAELGARLLMRYASANLGLTYDSVEAFAQAMVDKVARLSAMAVMETVASSSLLEKSRFQKSLSHSQKEFVAGTFVDDQHADIKMQVSINFPIVALGAPVASYYPKAAQWLGTEAILNTEGSVANALGAVVGTVRQQQQLLITPASGRRVNVHYPQGTQEYDSLEAAVVPATQWAEEQAVSLAETSGAGDISVMHKRHDNIVEKDGERVFFESVIVAYASGRPKSVIRS